MSVEEMPDDPFEGNVEGEPGDEGVTGSGVLDRLFDGSVPGPPVSQLETDYKLPFHWAIAARGFIRTATGSGVPPIMEIVVGTVMGALKSFRSEDELDQEVQVSWAGGDEDGMPGEGDVPG